MGKKFGDVVSQERLIELLEVIEEMERSGRDIDEKELKLT